MSETTVQPSVDCAVIVVTYNSAKHIVSLLESLPPAASGLQLHTIVVDNGSTDETCPLARSVPDVTVVEAHVNLGYAGGINLGRSLAHPARFVAVLNPDLVLEPMSLRRLCDTLEDRSVGIAVPVIREAGRTYPSLRRDPSIARAFGDALLGSHFARRPGWFSETVAVGPSYEHPHDVDWATGAAFLVSTECFDVIGSWDERFFLYSEETDFAMRARDARFRVRFVPEAVVHHEQGGSGRSRALTALLAVNRIRLFEKRHHRPATTIFRVAVVLHELLRIHDPSHRPAFRAVARRSRWLGLPAAS